MVYVQKNVSIFSILCSTISSIIYNFFERRNVCNKPSHSRFRIPNDCVNHEVARKLNNPFMCTTSTID